MQCQSREFWVGIGCQRGTPRLVIEQAVQQVFQVNHLEEGAIAGIATLDTKADEAGLVEFCRDRALPLRCFTAEVLRSVSVPNPSSAIEAAVSTPSVAEAAALLACWEAGAEGQSRGIERVETAATQRRGGIAQTVFLTPHTLSLFSQLCVPKQRFRSEGQAAAVTIAVAIASSPDTHRSSAVF